MIALKSPSILHDPHLDESELHLPKLGEKELLEACSTLTRLAVESGAVPHLAEAIELLESLDYALNQLKDRNDISRALFLEAVTLLQDDKLLLRADGSVALDCTGGVISLLDKKGQKVNLVEELVRDLEAPRGISIEEVAEVRRSLSHHQLTSLRAAASSAADKEFVRQELPKALAKGIEDATCIVASHLIERQLELLLGKMQ